MDLFGQQIAWASAVINRVQHRTEELDIVLVEEATITELESCLRGCQSCASNATLVLNYLLDALTGNDPMSAEYLLARPARCPSCSSEVLEQTLVAA